MGSGSVSLWSVCLLLVYVLITVQTVPPEACFANFRWDDCGKSPVPVMYYWKPGSRCEVGLWRGCLPNINMFSDEYECVNTCIFAARAMPMDYHSMNENEIGQALQEDFTETVTESDNSTEETSDNITTGTDSGGTTNAVTVTVGSEGTSGGGDSTAASEKATTAASEKATTAAGGDATATTNAG